MSENERRRFLRMLAIAGTGGVLAGCDKLAGNDSFRSLLSAADKPTDKALHEFRRTEVPACP